jgi:GNAT superfamily N-acetyltransferase
MALLIRPIEHDDVSAAALVLQGGSLTSDVEDETNVEAYWRAVESTRANDGDVLVADLDGEVVGVCQVIVFAHFQHTGARCGELESVHVRSDLRSQGIGTALIKAAEEFAKQQGCYRVQLTSRNVRLDAHRFYLTNGFEQTSQGFKKSI